MENAQTTSQQVAAQEIKGWHLPPNIWFLLAVTATVLDLVGSVLSAPEPPPTPGLRREGSRGDEKGISYQSMGDKAPFLPVFAGSMVLFPLGGIAWGYGMWIYFEKVYWEAKASEQALATDTEAPHRNP